jgi:hypothetical protein
MPRNPTITGGHVPDYLREAFCELLKTGEVPVEQLFNPYVAQPDPVRWLTDLLWNCGDILPKWVRDLTEGEEGRICWTYGQAARAVRSGRIIIESPAHMRG